MRWDWLGLLIFFSSCGGKASPSRVWRAQVGLVRVSASGKLSHQCQHQWGWAGCVMVPALQGGSMPWGNGKLILFVVAFLSHLEKMWCSWFSLATSRSVPSKSVKDGLHSSPPSLLFFFLPGAVRRIGVGAKSYPMLSPVFWGLSSPSP